jgi:hypothetical protein
MRDSRQHVHELIDQLAPSQIDTVVQLLEVIVEGEPVTDEDRRRYHDGLAAFAKGSGIPMESVLAEFGMKFEDFPLKR